jgi:superfamily I DNA/RNA helicase
VDIRGRSKTLKINYRTSHQIRRQADLLLDPEVADVDGNVEDRRGAVSVFNGAAPLVAVYETSNEEATAVAAWLKGRLAEGVMPHEIGIFVRSDQELLRAQTAADEAGLAFKNLDQKMEMASAHASIATMHLAKGLEFRAVVVMACDDEVLPSATRIETVTDDSDLQEVYNTERHLLYVACTRARDFLLVTGVTPGSEFLEDLRGASQH